MRNHRRATDPQHDLILCGFGAVLSAPPTRCPICGSSDWGPAPRVDGRLRPSMPRVATTGSRTSGKRDENDVPRDERTQRTPSLTNGASPGGPRRKEHVMKGLDCERTAGR